MLSSFFQLNKFRNSSRCGRCKLENVKVYNKGIDWSYPDNVYWKHEVRRFEMLKIVLHGNAEFEALDVVLQVTYTQMLICEIFFMLMTSLIIKFVDCFHIFCVNIQGNYIFEVPEGHKLRVTTGISGSSCSFGAQ